MGKPSHVLLEHYLLLSRGKMGPGELLKRMHRHVLEECPECREAWEELVDGQRADLGELLSGHDEPIPFDPTPPPEVPTLKPSPYESAFSGAARKVTRAASRVVQEKRRARAELGHLLAIPPAERAAAIRRSRKRFRTPSLGHLLIEEARERVRRSWQEALELLDLADLVVLWIPGAHASEWGRAHAARVAAHRANAYRVGGDLAEADRRFRELRRELALGSLVVPSLDAEVASLEGSLRWDQRRHEEAAALLDQAVLIFQEVGEVEGLGRTLIQRASIAQERERYDQALADLERARGLVDSREQRFLYRLTVAAGASLLIDLNRYAEAEQVLAEAKDAEAAAEPWWSLRVRGLLGRSAFGRGDLDRAEELLAEAREGLLDQRLPYDAAAASLHLALVHLHQGRTAEVRRLCREIAPIFRGVGIEREALATLRLFGQATAANAATLSQLTELRRFVDVARGAAQKAPVPS